MAQLFHLSGQTLVDGNGAPYAAAKAYFYETGTTTPKTTYSNAGLSSSNANPVVADANGRFGDIYLIAGRYKVVYATSADVTIDTLDPVDGTSQLITASSAPGTTYPFLRYYNTVDGRVYRRNAANSGWIDEGLVDELINAATVSEVLTGTSTAKAVTPDSLAGVWQRGTDIASASTLSLPAGGGGVFNVTGTTGVTAISSAQGGRCIKLRFAGALIITHNATSMILPGAANITTAAGDTAIFVNEAAQDASGSNWRCWSYQRASGSPINATDLIATQANQETGSSTTLLVTPGRQQYHQSAAKAWVYFDASSGTPTAPSSATSYNVASITDGGVGVFTPTWTTAFSSATYVTTGSSRSNILNASTVVSQNTTQTKATTGQPLTTRVSSTDAAVDVGDCSISAFGDQ
jgi:hypothetical protein